MKVSIEVSNACNRCGLCVEYCPAGVFRVVDTCLEADHDKCIFCKGCEVLCPAEAIRVRALNEGLNILKRKTLVSAN